MCQPTHTNKFRGDMYSPVVLPLARNMQSKIAMWYLASLALLFTALFSAPLQAEPASLRIGGTGGALATMQKLAKEFRQSHPDIVIIIPPSLGSGGGIKALLAGALDISVSARLLKPKEQAAGAQAIAFAKTPFILASSPDNPTTGITVAELAAIYSGEQLHWRDGRRIRLLLRHSHDSDTKLLRSMSADIDRALDVAYTQPGLRITSTDQESASALERTPGALGTSTLALMHSENRAFKVLALNGVMPSTATLSDGSYPYHKTFYLVTGQNPSPPARAFLDFMRSPRAHTVLGANGSLPLRN